MYPPNVRRPPKWKYRTLPILSAVVAATLFWSRADAGAGTTLTAGGSGWALRFDGVDDFVLLEAEMPPAPWTIEMWVKPESLANGDGTSLVTFNPKGAILSRTSMVGGEVILQVAYNGAQVWYPSTYHLGVESDEVRPSGAVGQLYHWALTKTENTSRVYLNGVLASETSLVPQEIDD